MLSILKRTVPAFFACCFALLAVMPAAADSMQSDEERKRENYHRKGKWGYTVLDDGTAAVSDYFGKAKELNIPEKIDGYTVTVIGGGWYFDDSGKPVLYGNLHGLSYAEDGSIEQSSVYSPFTGNEHIETVILPDTVTAIGAISFQGCTSLKKVEINEGVEIIGNNCFEGCIELEEINLPDSLKFVDQQAFYDCRSLKEINIPDADYETAAFEYCTGLESVTLPDGMKSVSPYMFSECTALTSVTFSDTIEDIGDSAFYKCTALEKIELPDSVTAIYNNAFSGCTSLSQVSVGEGLDTLGSRAFANCTALKELYLSEKVNKIGDSAFGMTESGDSIEGFTLVCPDLSVINEYAKAHEINVNLVAPAESDKSSSEQDIGIPEGVDPEVMFYVIVGVLVAAAIAVVIILVLMIKNHKAPEEPSDSEETFDEE